MKAVIDTNVLVDYLQGNAKARTELASYQKPVISLITWMEVMTGAESPGEADTLRSFLKRFTVSPISIEVAESAVAIRQEYRIRLPDAIIWATAQVLEAILVTRNTRDFPADAPDIRVPYRV